MSSSAAKLFKHLQDTIDYTKALGEPVDHLVRRQISLAEEAYNQFLSLAENHPEWEINPERYEMELVYLGGLETLKRSIGEGIDDIKARQNEVESLLRRLAITECPEELASQERVSRQSKNSASSLSCHGNLDL